MGSFSGTEIPNDNLIFYVDMGNSHSWKGKPTTNFAGHRGIRKTDSSYTVSDYNPGGSFLKNHPESIVIYFLDGASQHAAVNGGVTDYTNTHHGYHYYDEDLREPVYRMRDVDAQWKARSFGLNKTWSQMGITTGDTYTISWKQKTTNLSKTASIGLYGKSNSDTFGFHDGRSPGQGTGVKYNTKLNTWQQLYATFTMGSSFDPNSSTNVSVYGYGHYTTRAEFRVTDFQIEKGSFSGYHHSTSARTSTQCLLDLTGNHTITLNSLDYQADGTFEFSDSTDYATITGGSLDTEKGDITMMAWVDQGSRNGPHQTIICTHIGYRNGMKLMSAYHSNGAAMWVGNSDGTNSTLVTSGTSIENTGLKHIAATRKSSDGAIKLYINGVLASSGTGVTGDVYTPSGYAYLGLEYHSSSYGLNATVHNVKVYDAVLSANDIKGIYEAERTQHGV